MICTSVLLLGAVFLSGTHAFSIEEYGAIEGVDTYEVAEMNAASVLKALYAANSSLTDRTVEFPEGKTFFITQLEAVGLKDIKLQFDGTVKINDDLENWPEANGRGAFDFTDCDFLTFEGKGMIDGQGLKWWRRCYTGVDNRFHLFHFTTCRWTSFYDVQLYNSQKFHLTLSDSAHVMIDGITIYVDSTLIRAGDWESVMYPLNTDGIDYRATNVTVKNCNITNYDDAIVAKPCNQGGKYCTCSGDAEVYNNTITYSVGLTIGSVSPSDKVNCVRNVHFYNNTMYRPLKAMYIKSNPGETGSAIIENIKYENIVVSQALWWLIWVGPQQQNQPGTSDIKTGCNFLFPFIPVCPTQPLVTMRNISFQNILSVDTLPLFEGPGVVLCDAANPCDVSFDNVNVTFFDGDVQQIFDALPINVPGIFFPTPNRSDNVSLEYITDNAQGSLTGYVNPVPCLNDESCYWDGKSKH